MTNDRRHAGAAQTALDIQWSDRAIDDLAAIDDYIAADNPAAAMRWVERLVADVKRAAEMPLAGRVVPEYADRHDIPEALRRTYRIVYRVRDDAIEVLTMGSAPNSWIWATSMIALPPLPRALRGTPTKAAMALRRSWASCLRAMPTAALSFTGRR